MGKSMINREKYIVAMKKLLNHYKKLQKDESSTLFRCPLCKINSASTCESCPWMIETGLNCRVFILKKFNISKLSGMPMVNFRNGETNAIINEDMIKIWIKLRIEQLTKWIKKWENENE